MPSGAESRVRIQFELGEIVNVEVEKKNSSVDIVAIKRKQQISRHNFDITERNICKICELAT